MNNDEIKVLDVLNNTFESSIKSSLQSTHSLKGMFIAVKETIFEAFVSKDRQAMRRALPYWADNGNIMWEIHEPRFPMIDFRLRDEK